MNSCVLSLTIKTPPESKLSQNQTAICSFLGEFQEQKENETSLIRCVSFGNLAQEIQADYSQGNQVICEGSLQMSLEEKDGYKEKTGTYLLNKIHSVEVDF